MKKRYTIKDNIESVRNYEKKFHAQKQFPPFPHPYSDRIIPVKHTGYLIFIRSKFLFFALLSSFEDRNLFASYSILKSYWENVAAFGYYYLRIENLLKDGNEAEALKLAMKMGIGGRGFLTEEMVKDKRIILADFTLPNIYTMMEKVDKEWQKKLGNENSMLRELYDAQIAEGGHTTFISLNISTRWLSDGSQLADVNKSWDRKEYASLLNLVAMSCDIFFYYWEKFARLSHNK